MSQLIIRADDLGLSEAVNYGILKTVENGVVNNVGLMVNMPSADHGYNLISKKEICIGLHANISIGEPVSNADKIPSLVEGKFFKSSNTYRNSDKDLVDLEEAVYEIENQVKLFQEKFDKKPDYLDFHAIISPNFMEAARRVAKSHEIPFIGMSLDDTAVDVEGYKVKMHISAGNNTVDIFNSFKDIINKKDQENLNLIAYHPGYIDLKLIEKSSLIQQRVYDTAFLISPDLRQYLAEKQIELLKFNQLKI